MGSRLWSEGETTYLVDNFENMTDKELEEKLGRTIPSVGLKRLNLGLIKQRKHKISKGKLQELYIQKGKTIFEIEELTGTPKSTVYRKLKTNDFPIRKRSMKGSSNPMYGRTPSKETRYKISIKAKQRWKNPEWRDMIVKAVMKGCWKRPTSIEKQFMSICNEHQLPFIYVGGGKLVINGKIPDFTDGDKKLIEIYGDYWHRNDNPLKIINHYKNSGYNCMVIWEHELKNEKLIVERVRDFMEVEG